MTSIDGQPMSAIYAAYTERERAVHMELIALHTLAVAAHAVHNALEKVLATDGNANHYSLPKLNEDLKWALNGWEMVRKYNESKEAT